MIDLFYPPQIEHKNARLVRGSASMGPIEDAHFESWSKTKWLNQYRRVLNKEELRATVCDLTEQVTLISKEVQSARDKYRANKTPELRAALKNKQKVKDNLKKKLDRAYQSFKKTFGEEP